MELLAAICEREKKAASTAMAPLHQKSPSLL